MRRPHKPLETADQLAVRTTLRNAIAYLDTHPEHTAEDVNNALAERIGRLARPLTEADVDAIRASIVRTRQQLTVAAKAFPAPGATPAAVPAEASATSLQAAREASAEQRAVN